MGAHPVSFAENAVEDDRVRKADDKEERRADRGALRGGVAQFNGTSCLWRVAEETGLTDDTADFSYTFDAVVDVCADCNGYVLSARRSESATS